MPTPLLLRRPSGLYARFRLPSHVSRRLDVRFLVRSLGPLRGDAARLVAARMGYALARTIETAGERVDKKLLDAALAAAQRGEVSPYKITTTPDGFTVEANGPEDHAQAMDALERIGTWAQLGLRVPPVPTPTATPAPVAEKDMLHGAMNLFLAQFRQRRRARSTVEETEHSLGLFRDLVDDVPLAELDHPTSTRSEPRWRIGRRAPVFVLSTATCRTRAPSSRRRKRGATAARFRSARSKNTWTDCACSSTGPSPVE